MAVKIELEKDEIKWIIYALDLANKSYSKDMDAVSKSKKIKLKDKQELIAGLMSEDGKISKLKRFFKICLFSMYSLMMWLILYYHQYIL